MDSQTSQEKKKHLIVLLPVCMANDFELAHKIHWMAYRKNCDVFYMTIAENNEGSLALSRDMATMKAVTAGNWLQAQWIQARPSDWVTRLQEIYRPEDEIVCTEEQAIDHSLSGQGKLYQIVKEAVAAEIHPVSGYDLPHEEVRRKRIPEFLAYAGFLVIIALITWLQIQVDAALRGTVDTVIVLILLCVEFGAIWAWNNFTLS